MVLYNNLGNSDLNPSLVGELPSYLIGVNAQSFPLHVTLEVIVRHADAELNVPIHVHHAAVRVVLGIDLPSEYLVGGDGGDHVGGSTVDGDIVTGAELKGACSQKLAIEDVKPLTSHVPDNKEGVLYLCQGCGCVVGEPWEGWINGSGWRV